MNFLGRIFLRKFECLGGKTGFFQRKYIMKIVNRAMDPFTKSEHVENWCYPRHDILFQSQPKSEIRKIA